MSYTLKVYRTETSFPMGEMDVYIHSFLTSALNAGGWTTSWTARFTLEEITPVPTE